MIGSIFRLCAAAAAGSVIGINRNLKHKPAGLRTNALVAVGSALAIIVGRDLAAGQSAVPAIQGIVTGIGFIGAGVILHHGETDRIEGLTTAASIWVVACLGAAAGAGLWFELIVGTGISFLILAEGGPMEDLFRAGLSRKEQPREEAGGTFKN